MEEEEKDPENRAIRAAEESIAQFLPQFERLGIAVRMTSDSGRMGIHVDGVQFTEPRKMPWEYLHLPECPDEDL